MNCKLVRWIDDTYIFNGSAVLCAPTLLSPKLIFIPNPATLDTARISFESGWFQENSYWISWKVFSFLFLSFGRPGDIAHIFWQTKSIRFIRTPRVWDANAIGFGESSGQHISFQSEEFILSFTKDFIWCLSNTSTSRSSMPAPSCQPFSCSE